MKKYSRREAVAKLASASVAAGMLVTPVARARPSPVADEALKAKLKQLEDQLGDRVKMTSSKEWENASQVARDCVMYAGSKGYKEWQEDFMELQQLFANVAIMVREGGTCFVEAFRLISPIRRYVRLLKLAIEHPQ